MQERFQVENAVCVLKSARQTRELNTTTVSGVSYTVANLITNPEILFVRPSL